MDSFNCLGSSVVERFHGKEEVEGSTPSPGSIKSVLAFEFCSNGQHNELRKYFPALAQLARAAVL